jgi:hypothetical protein
MRPLCAIVREASGRKLLLLVATVFGYALPAGAAPASAQFMVTATLVVENASATTQTGFCTSGPGRATFGAVVMVVCGTGAVVDIDAPKTAVPWSALHGGAYRYAHVEEYELPGARLMDGVDSYTGPGTITSWRMVSLADRDYFEVQIGW